MKIQLLPTPEQSDPATGIGRVVINQYKHLDKFGIELVQDPRAADLVAAHTQQFGQSPEVIHCHGLYWTGDPGSGNYASWHTGVNTEIIQAIRQSVAFSVPSEWVAMPFRRDMLVNPWVIGHGINVDSWDPIGPQNKYGYALWNKNRDGDVCDPAPAYEVAKLGFPVWSTFGPKEFDPIDTFRVIGRQDYETMKRIIRQAGVYLATTKETFGIGTLEAMACGVPVLGFDWGGTADIVRSGVDGILVKPYDYEALEAGYVNIDENWAEYSQAARARAEAYDWPIVISKYADLYRSIEDHRENESVAIVIPCHNYENWVSEAVQSALNQLYPVEEVVVVEDGSTDNSLAVLRANFGDNPRVKIVSTDGLGVAAARNMGIEMTSADLIICLDADDRLNSSYVTTCRQAMIEDRSLGIVYTGLCFVKADGTNDPYDAWPNEFDWTIQSKVNVPPYNCIPSAAMFRRSLWSRAGGYRQDYAPGEDCELWTNGLALGFGCKRVTPANYFEYRAHPGSASKTKKYKRIDGWKPWMRDHQYPLGAPADRAPDIRSYSQPDISVIIPVGKGHVDLVASALESLMGQDYRNWEVIVVNDTGEDLDLSQAPHRFPFAKVIHTNGNTGAGAARNLGASKAKGAFLVFLDADDFLAPAALEKFRSAAEPDRFIYSDWVVGQDVHESPEFNCESYSESLPIPVTCLIERSAFDAVQGFDETLPSWEDWDFFLKLITKGFCGKRVPEPLLVYRLDTGSRRKRAQKISPALKKEILSRYSNNGGTEMGNCGGCPQGGVAVMAAKEAFDGQAAPRAATSQPGWSRVQYSGPRVGGVAYFGKAGRVYRFGNNPIESINDVHPEDVDLFMRLADFTILGSVTPAVTDPMVPTPGAVDEEQRFGGMTEEELDEENAQLMAELEELEAEAEAEDTDAIAEESPAFEFASSAAEKLAASANLPDTLLARIEGSGKDGKITAGDIRELMAE